MRWTRKDKDRLRWVYTRILGHYGPSPYRAGPPPPLFLVLRPAEGSMGWCEHDGIWVNLARCDSWTDAVGTLIHEVWHLHQHPGWYTRYLREHGYDEHPYEREADDVAARDLELFL